MPASRIIVIDGQFEENPEPFAPHIVAFALRTPQVAEVVPHLRFKAQTAQLALSTPIFTSIVVFITPYIEVAAE